MKKVSIIILNWNGKKFLKNCLISLKKVNYSPLEIIVVDNGSTDGSQKMVEKFMGTTVKLIANQFNLGFAKGNNLGYQASTGDYLLFLNNDTVVTADFLNTLVKKLKNNSRIGCLQPQIRILKNKNLLDEVGSYLTFTGFLYHFGFLKDCGDKIYQQPREIFSAKGACLLIPRRVLKEVGLFDEDFFIFFEETDLCQRIWLAGYKIMYEPAAIIYHFVAGDTARTFNDEKRIYLAFKNMLCCYLKNFGNKNLLKVLPVFLSINFCLFIYYLLTLQFRLGKSILCAYYWNLVNLKSTLTKRKIIQKKLRRKSDDEINSSIMKNPRLPYYYYLFVDSLKNYADG